MGCVLGLQDGERGTRKELEWGRKELEWKIDGRSHLQFDVPMHDIVLVHVIDGAENLHAKLRRLQLADPPPRLVVEDPQQVAPAAQLDHDVQVLLVLVRLEQPQHVGVVHGPEHLDLVHVVLPLLLVILVLPEESLEGVSGGGRTGGHED